MNEETRKAITATITATGGFNFWGGYPYCDGLPSGVVVEPNTRLAAEGVEVIVVTATQVQRYRVRPPYNYSRWRGIGTARLYSSPREMTSILRTEVEGEKGCW